MDEVTCLQQQERETNRKNNRDSNPCPLAPKAARRRRHSYSPRSHSRRVTSQQAGRYAPRSDRSPAPLPEGRVKQGMWGHRFPAQWAVQERLWSAPTPRPEALSQKKTQFNTAPNTTSQRSCCKPKWKKWGVRGERGGRGLGRGGGRERVGAGGGKGNDVF